MGNKLSRDAIHVSDTQRSRSVSDEPSFCVDERGMEGNPALVCEGHLANLRQKAGDQELPIRPAGGPPPWPQGATLTFRCESEPH